MQVIAEANRIKDRLRACKTRDEIERVAAEERATVINMRVAVGGKPLAIQIAHLKARMIEGMS
ncbi:MAG: hypothetical protein AAFQ58_19170 [Pseudomonadota bacterium]